MIFWTIQQIILSITIIACVHYIYVYFKNNLTIPKTKDLVKKPIEQYKEIYESISNNNKNSDNMKAELKDYIKQLANEAKEKGNPNKIMELPTSSSEINRQIDKVGNMFMNGGGGPAFSSY
jgi:gas vesicle protein